MAGLHRYVWGLLQRRCSTVVSNRTEPLASFHPSPSHGSKPVRAIAGDSAKRRGGRNNNRYKTYVNRSAFPPPAT